MSKEIKARVGSYISKADNQKKGEYVKIGVIMSNENGEYALIDPAVSLAGVLAKQNAVALADGKPVRSNIMCSVFDNSDKSNNEPHPAVDKPADQPQPSNDFDDDIPF